jgi:UrcA family protein
MIGFGEVVLTFLMARNLMGLLKHLSHVTHRRASMANRVKWISSLAVATAVSLVSFPSSAADRVDADVPSKTVKAWDLDLAKPEDVQTLYSRVQDAASDVCKAEAQRYRRSTRRQAPMGWTQQCTKEAVDATVADIASARLAALHVRLSNATAGLL